MTILIKQLINFIRLLHSDSDTKPLAWGLTLGAFLGFSPFFSIQTFLVLLIVLVFKVQFGTATLSAFFFKLIAFIIDPLADILGRSVLESEVMRPTFAKMYNMPIVPYTRFNNSIIMGSFIFALLLSPFLYFGFKILIEKYRTNIVHSFEQTKLWKSFKATKIHDWYQKYDNLYGAP